MRRRDLLKAFAAAPLLAMPRVSSAQPIDAPVIAWLGVIGSEDSVWEALLASGLAGEGFVPGDNVHLVFVNVASSAGAIRAGVNQILTRFEPDIIIAGGRERAEALMEATSTIPIVFNNVDDPSLLVSDLSRPEGNATGFWVGGRPVSTRIETLQMLVPDLRRVIYLFHLRDEPRERYADYEVGIGAAGLEFVPVGVFDTNEIETVLSEYAFQPGTGILVSAGGTFYWDRPPVIAAVNAVRIPASFFWSQYAQEGGLMSIGPDMYDPVRHTGGYVGRILNGEAIADLPVEASTKYRLTLNLATARAMGWPIPAELRDNADLLLG